MTVFRLKKRAFLFLAVLMLAAFPALADGNIPDSDLKKALGKPADSLIIHDDLSVPNATGDNSIRLTPDRTRILRLDQDAASVVVANPAHAVVLLDSARLIVIMPREPGTTSFTVLDDKGKTILERNIIVTGAQKKYVRVRKICSGNDAGCAPSSYYYCPDGCYEVTPVSGADGQPNVPPPGNQAPPNIVIEEDAAPPAGAVPAPDSVPDPDDAPVLIDDSGNPLPEGGAPQ